MSMFAHGNSRIGADMMASNPPCFRPPAASNEKLQGRLEKRSEGGNSNEQLVQLDYPRKNMKTFMPIGVLTICSTRGTVIATIVGKTPMQLVENPTTMTSAKLNFPASAARDPILNREGALAPDFHVGF
ncbi:hypothetical protein B0H11DRAFT_1906528 [Mycena galericulata]|nr:hypothetical protein B0H11DRAFT_1906528 [Mycena galericulata]